MPINFSNVMLRKRLFLYPMKSVYSRYVSFKKALYYQLISRQEILLKLYFSAVTTRYKLIIQDLLMVFKPVLFFNFYK